MIYCPFCNTANRNGSKFCNECGGSLSEDPLVCSQCGTRNPPLHSFCRACGQRQSSPGQLLSPSSEIAAATPVAERSLDGELPSFEADVSSLSLSLSPVSALDVEIPGVEESADDTGPALALAQDGFEPQATSAESTLVPAELPAWLELPEPTPSPPAVPSAPETPGPAPLLAELPAWLLLYESAASFPQLPDWLWLQETTGPPEKVLPDWLGLSDEPSGAGIVVEAIAAGELPSWLFLLETAHRMLPGWLEIEDEPTAVKRSLPEWLSLVEPAPPEPPTARVLPSWLSLDDEPLPGPGVTIRRPAEIPEEEAPLAIGPEVAEVPGAIVLARPFQTAQPPRRTITEQAPSSDYEAVFSEMLQPKTDLTPAVKMPTGRQPRLVSLLLMAVVSLGLLFPMGINVEPQRDTVNIFETIQALPATANVLVTFDWAPGSDEEMAPVAEAILRHLVQRKVKIVAVSLTPEGGKLAQRILDRSVLGSKGYEYGKQAVNLGYLPGGEAAIRAMMADLPRAYGVDHFGSPTRDIALLKEFRTFKSADLVVVLAAEPEMLTKWVTQVSATYQGIRMVAGVAAAAVPWAQPFSASGASGHVPQLRGTLAGIRGAAEYELATNQPKLAIAAIDAQSLGSVFIAVVIVVGNLALLRDRLRRTGPADGARAGSQGG